jgi:hypothetical protein
MEKIKIIQQYLEAQITWKATNNPEFPFATTYNGNPLKLRVNNFPTKEMYTLLVNDEEICDFDDIPQYWHLPS